MRIPWKPSARAYERERPKSSKVADREVVWTERVQVIRSRELAKRQAQQLDERLGEATAALRDLTPPVGRGHQQYREEEQIVALTRLLTIALRVLALSALQVRSGLAKAEAALTGLYEGQPNRATEYPTAGRCLKAIGRMEIPRRITLLVSLGLARSWST